MSKKKNKPSKRLLKKQKELGNPAVIFSFDGTIMDTEPAIFASYRNIFDLFDKKRRFTEEMQEMVMGQPAEKMMREFFPKGDQDEIMKEYRLYQSYHLADLIQPMHGIEDFLRWLKDNHYPTAIISSRQRSSIVSMLEHSGLLRYIDVIIASSSRNHELSGDDSLRKAAKLLHSKCCIYIGHTASHIITGHTVGAFTIAYDPTPQRIYDIIEAGPDFVTADFRQIRKLLEGTPFWVAYEILEPQTETNSASAVQPETK